MKDQEQQTPQKQSERRFGCLQVLGLLVLAVGLTVVITIWAMKAYLFPADFTPVTLNAQEEQLLTAKLENLEQLGAAGAPAETGERERPSRDDALAPEAYSEQGTHRDINFTERELNALLAKNTDLARKLAIDLADDLVSAKLLLPLDEDFPILGGKTLRVKTGLGFAYEAGKPVVILKGVTIMGVPIPNAWLGGIKNIDLVKEFGTDDGFWKAFAEGVAAIKVKEGRLMVELKE